MLSIDYGTNKQSVTKQLNKTRSAA